MDADLVRMTCSRSAVQLHVGEAFVALGNEWQELGFSSFEAYVRERCVRSGRWGREVRLLARRLSALPGTRRALLGGELRWCAAEVLARVATAEDEAELLEATRGMTVRQVREALRDRDDEEARYCTLDLAVPVEHAWLLESTRAMIEAMEGRGEPGSWLEALLAEGQSWLAIVADPSVEHLPEDVVDGQRRWLARVAFAERMRERREERAEAGLPAMPAIDFDERREPLPLGANAIDRVITRELAPRLASCDLRFGELLARFFAARAWELLGFASEQQYARERLGMSYSAVCARIAFARRAEGLEALKDALRDGELGFEAAALIARVATPDTVGDWVARGRVRTFKHLREEVQAAEMIARLMRAEDPEAPTADEVGVVHRLSSDLASGAYARRALGMARDDDDAPAVATSAGEPYRQLAHASREVEEALRAVVLLSSGDHRDALLQTSAAAERDAHRAAIQTSAAAAPAERRDADAQTSAAPERDGHDAAIQTSAAAEPADRDGIDAAVQTSADERDATGTSAARGRRRNAHVRVRVREDVLFYYRQLETAYTRSGLQGTFVEFLVLGFWTTWSPIAGRSNRCERITRRDRYECTSPVCGRPSGVGSHHVRFRAHGGGDEDENLTSPCDYCHLEGVHGGRLRVHGSAPDLIWQVGRTPIMEVRGRERRLLA